MEMHQIRYFLAVCDHGSITHAAQFSLCLAAVFNAGHKKTGR